jgi:hypothetical protein
MNEAEMRALFVLAGIAVENHWQLANGYWPEAYADLRAQSPWWLVQTRFGNIRLGWRKRVISIEWDATKIRGVVTKDDVTKDETMVHAWSYHKAVEYLGNFRRIAERAITPDSSRSDTETPNG